MTEEELTTRVTQELKGLATNFVAQDYVNAIDSAGEETGFTLPNTNTEQITWLVRRTKRHLIYSLWVQNATKFKVKQLSLNQKFDHLGRLIEQMDKEYETAKDDIGFGDAAVAWAYFGHKIDAGFQYNEVTGEDTTYTDLNEVDISPTGEESA